MGNRLDILTRSVRGYMLVRMLVQADIGKMWKRHCGTMIEKAQQTTFALPKEQSVSTSIQKYRY